MSNKLTSRLRAGAVFATNVATVLTMSGVVYLAPVAVQSAGAVTLVDGDTVKTAASPDVYILKMVGAKKFKRLVLNPAIFDSYGQLSWSKIKTVDQATLDMYMNSNVVIHVNAAGVVVDPKVWSVTSPANSDSGTKKWLNITGAEFTSAGLDWDSIYKINDLEAADTFYPTGTALTTSDNLMAWATNVNGGGTQQVPASGLSVSLASSTPAARNVASGSADVVFAKYMLTAGSAGSVKITEISVMRGGISTTANWTDVKLYRNAVSVDNKIGGTLTLSTTTQKARFTGLNWTLNAGASDTLIVTGSIHATNAIGNSMTLGLNMASDIVLDAGAAVSGSFPMFGNPVTPTTAGVGGMTVVVLNSPAAQSLISGATEQQVASIRFAATTENFRVNSVRITQTGTAGPADSSNFKLKYLTDTVGTLSTLASNNTGTIALSDTNDLNLVKTTATKTFDLYADVAGGINVDRTFIVTVQGATDVVVTGQSSGGSVAVTHATVNDCSADQTFPSTACTMTLTRGTFTAAVSSGYNPAADNIVIGRSNVKGLALRVSAGSDEAIRVTQLKATVTLADTAAVGTITLANVNADGSVGSTIAQGTLTGTSVTFGSNTINAFDTAGLFDVEKGKNKDVYVLFDVPAGITVAGGNDTVIVSIAANADVKADGLSSMTDLAACTSCTATGNTFTETSVGTFAYANTGTPVATTIVPGQTGIDFTHWAFTASGEDIKVSSLQIFAEEADGNAIDGSGDVTNVKFYKDSATAANLLASQSTVTNGVVSVSFNDTVMAGTTRTYILVADTPTTISGESQIRFTIDDATDLTASGVFSGTDIVGPGSDLDGNFMTVAQGTLGVIASGLPVYTNVTQLSSDVEVGRFVFTAGASEDVRLNTVAVKLAGAANQAANKSIDPAALTNVKLFDVNAVGQPQVGTTVGSFDGTTFKATFSGLNKTIMKGGQLVLGVKVTIGSVADTRNIVVGIDDYYTDVVAVGVLSGTTVYANQLVGNGTNGTTSGQLATLFAASAANDTDLTANMVDADDELAGYGVPTLGITALVAGDVIQIESEAIIATTVANSTVARPGMFGTTAAAHNTTGVPLLLKVGGKTILESANNTTTYTDGNGAVTFTSTIVATFAAGNLHAAYDVDVANQEDDFRLTTAVSSNGLTLTTVDAYQGTAVTEAAGANGYHVRLTNYGQAQQVQTAGILTLAVGSDTALPHQVVAGSTDISFSRVKLTSQYEKTRVTQLVFTRSGGSDIDFASVYLFNVTDPTWGPNGNGKSNNVQLVGGLATFSFSDANGIIVDQNAASGTTVSIRGNLNTTTTGVASGDAPKFYIAATTVANVTAKGVSSGVTYTDAGSDQIQSGTPDPATAGNFNAQTLFKGKLDIVLNSGSLSGNQTRSSNQTILKTDFDSADNGEVATFRAASLNVATATTTDFSPVTPGTDTDGDWAVITVGDDGSTAAASATNGIGSTASILFTQGATTPVAANGVTYSGVNLDLSGYNGMAVWIRPSNATPNLTWTLTGASLGSQTVLGTSMTNGTWTLIDVPFSTATTPFTGLTAVTAISIVSASAYTAGDTVNFDNFYFYKDKVVVNAASNAGLFATTAAQNTASATLNDGSNVLATGWYSGTTSAGNMSFFPTSQFTVPLTGKTLSVVADTTVLITATSRTLSMTVPLGSSDNGGTITAGNVFWSDTALSATIKWVDSVISPVQSGTISY